MQQKSYYYVEAKKSLFGCGSMAIVDKTLQYRDYSLAYVYNEL